MSAPRNRATTGRLASIYRKATGVNALLDILGSIARTRDQIVRIVPALNVPCARMSPVSTITLVCAGVDILERIVILL